MFNPRWRSLRLSQFVLPLCLLTQVCLLVARLDLLPVWGDEHFTLRAASGSVAQTLEAIDAEKNNPPLHTLLLQFWLTIAWPFGKGVAARLLSVLFALASTIVIDRLWLRPLSPRIRLWFLLLWALSPCLLLYARMARSYSLQVLVFAVVLRMAVDLVRQPRLRWRGLIFSVGIACLLYVHYLPGLALLSSTVLGLAWRGIRAPRPAVLRTTAGVVVSVALLYTPWLPQLGVALGRMARAQSPPLDAGGLMQEAVRPGYLLFSFWLGETPPLWVLLAAALVAPATAYLVWKGARTRPEWMGIALVAAAAAYVGAARWVSFVFTPGRLLFLLPFFLLLLAMGVERSRRVGWVAGGATLCLSVAGIAGYFLKTDFLNKGYLLPYEEIARIVTKGSVGSTAALIADTWNTDPFPLADLVPREVRVILVSRDSTEASLRERLADSGAELVWYFRNTHDTSPGGVNKRLEEELARGRLVRQYLFLPYSRRDQLLMQVLGWKERPTHFVQLLEMRPSGGGPGPAGTKPASDQPRRF